MNNVFIAENMASTVNGIYLKSFQLASDIENCQLVAKGALIGSERDLHTAVAVAAITDEVYITDGVELIYDESPTKGLDDFTNLADKPFRVRKAVKGDVFSVSVSACTALATTLVAGNVVQTSASGGNFDEQESAGATASFVANIVALWTFGEKGRAIPMVRLEVVKSL